MFDQSTLLRREAGEKLIGRRRWCSGSGQWRQGQLQKEEEKDVGFLRTDYVLRDSSGLASCATPNGGMRVSAGGEDTMRMITSSCNAACEAARRTSSSGPSCGSSSCGCPRCGAHLGPVGTICSSMAFEELDRVSKTECYDPLQD